jgi:hypothetical protein
MLKTREMFEGSDDTQTIRGQKDGGEWTDMSISQVVLIYCLNVSYVLGDFRINIIQNDVS